MPNVAQNLPFVHVTEHWWTCSLLCFMLADVFSLNHKIKRKNTKSTRQVGENFTVKSVLNLDVPGSEWSITSKTPGRVSFKMVPYQKICCRFTYLDKTTSDNKGFFRSDRWFKGFCQYLRYDLQKWAKLYWLISWSNHYDWYLFNSFLFMNIQTIQKWPSIT